jgi:hypothetical protein
VNRRNFPDERKRRNKLIVAQTKGALIASGYPTKTSELYEAFSKALGYPSYNVACADKVDFHELFDPGAIMPDAIPALLRHPLLEILEDLAENQHQWLD